MNQITKKEPSFKADLHTHSLCSDGTYSPLSLLKYAEDLGLGALSITDHDTLEAYHHYKVHQIKSRVCILPGVEFSCCYKRISIHVLAYSFDIQHPSLKKLCEMNQKKRQERVKDILNKLQLKGINISFEDVFYSLGPKEVGVLGRVHVAKSMLDKGYVTSIQEAFNLYIGQNRSCYVPYNVFSVEETLRVIHAAKGMAILAHPHLIRQKYVAKELLSLAFDGIEGYYSRLSKDRENYWIYRALERKWILTGGSDFHGSIKAQTQLGCSWTSLETFDKLYSIFRKNNL